MRRQVGSCASSAAISAGVDGTFALWMTAPFRPMTQTCVSAIDTSSPAKYSIVGSPLPMTKPILSASAEEPRPLPDVDNCARLGVDNPRHRPPLKPRLDDLIAGITIWLGDRD